MPGVACLIITKAQLDCCCISFWDRIVWIFFTICVQTLASVWPDGNWEKRGGGEGRRHDGKCWFYMLSKQALRGFLTSQLPWTGSLLLLCTRLCSFCRLPQIKSILCSVVLALAWINWFCYHSGRVTLSQISNHERKKETKETSAQLRLFWSLPTVICEGESGGIWRVARVREHWVTISI